MDTTYLVTHLEDLFRIIREVREEHVTEFRSSEVSSLTFYRGQASSGWALSPRLYRENLHTYEQLLVNDALRMAPDEFKGLSDFQRLAKMQHLGLPTRLLDVTTNPMAALLFACIEQPDEDGEVTIFPNLPTTRESGYPCNAVMQFVFHHSWHQLSVDDFAAEVPDALPLKERTLTEQRASVRHTLTIPFSAVLPDNSNPRLTAQAGAFLLCGMNVVKVRDQYERWYPRKDVFATRTSNPERQPRCLICRKKPNEEPQNPCSRQRQAGAPGST